MLGAEFHSGSTAAWYRGPPRRGTLFTEGRMANGSEQAIDNATRLSEIGFPEFTAQLITDTFNAITASYIDQMAQYMNVVQVVSQTLQDYINNTRDDIGADEINSFLVSIGGLNDDA